MLEKETDEWRIQAKQTGFEILGEPFDPPPKNTANWDHGGGGKQLRCF